MITRRSLILNASSLFAIPALVRCESLEYGLLRGVNIDPKVVAYKLKVMLPAPPWTQGTLWWKSTLAPGMIKEGLEVTKVMNDLSEKLDLEYALKRTSEIALYTYDINGNAITDLKI